MPTTTSLLVVGACTLAAPTTTLAADLSPGTSVAAPASAPPPASRLRESGGYLTLAPASVGVTFIGAPVPSYQ